MAKISIIIPVYNSEKYIRRCLNSILNQTFQDFEIILIDDNSKDNSLKIICEIEKTYKDKIKILKNDKNIGAGASRNKGLKIASGEYITFIDSDDYIEKNTLKRMYESCVNTDSDIARINMIKVFSGKDVSFLGRRSNIDEHKIIIPKEEIPSFTDKELEEQLNFLSIVNCLQRTRDILYSNIPYQKKKELITLVSSLIKVKYGTWQDNELYKKYKERRIPYNIRMSIIEKYFIEEIEELSEKKIKDAITKKLEKI